MKVFQQIKVFTGSTPEELEEAFNTWSRALKEFHATTPALRATPIVIHERTMAVEKRAKEVLYVLGVFYDHYEVEDHERGADRGGHIRGASAYSRK